jgi:hypothetical protein
MPNIPTRRRPGADHRVRPADPSKLDHRLAIGKARPVVSTSVESTEDNPVFALLSPDERDVMVWLRSGMGQRRTAAMMGRSKDEVLRLQWSARAKLSFLLQVRDRLVEDPRLLTAFLRRTSDLPQACPLLTEFLACGRCLRGGDCPQEG